MSSSKEHPSIRDARRGFNAELLGPAYDRVHSDDEHLAQLIAYLAVAPGGAYLDLGTGNGYVALALARGHADCRVVGVDIADQAIAKNRETARGEGLSNVVFQITDGIILDFPDGAFDGVISRYALHHFPEPATTLGEIHRVLKPGGRLVIADAVMNDRDEVDFINQFQALKGDGHVRMGRRAEVLQLISEYGFIKLYNHMTSLRFYRKLNAENRQLIEHAPQAILNLYEVELGNDSVSVRLDILNASFSRSRP